MMMFRENSAKQVFCSLLAALLLCAGMPSPVKSESASTLREFAAALDEHAALLESSFTVFCNGDVIDRLTEPSAADPKNSLLLEITTNAGVYGPYSYTWYRDRIQLSGVSYRSGWRILRLALNGRTDMLLPREQRVLEEALALVSGASGTDLEKERYIFDRLCERIAYEASEDGSGDKDCATGALLNGRADCDGYADAMLLCCGLAGIPCRYLSGDSRRPSSPDGGHTWNLVCIGGSWLMCDATWGDTDQGPPSYLFFNLGAQDAADSYIWSQETLFTGVADNADYAFQLMPDQRPYPVNSLEDVYYAARAAASAGADHFTLFCPGARLWKTEGENFVKALRQGAIGAYSYNDTGRLFAVYAASLPQTAFRFADTEQEALSAISEYAERGIRSFSLYFHPSLAGKLFANERAGLDRLLSMSYLERPGTYRYSDHSGSVTLEAAGFIDSLPSCSSADEVVSLIRRELPAKPDSLAFLLPDGLAFSSVQEQAGAAAYSLGVKNFFYSTVGNRVTLDRLSYYENFCLAQSKDDVLEYMKQIRKDGKSELRVYCTEQLYKSLMADHAATFFAMLRKAGFSHYSVSYNDSCRLLMAEGLR